MYAKRSSTRHHLGRVASMYVGDGYPARYCLVDDYSEGGVRISLHGFTIPDEFVLRFSGKERVTSGVYRVIWRQGHTAGAELIAQRPS